MGSVFSTNCSQMPLFYLLKSISVIVLYSVAGHVRKDSETFCNTHLLLHITTNFVVYKHYTNFDAKSNL